MKYDDKAVLITGGATGIGKAAAIAFAREGAGVMIGDVDERAVETVKIIEATGGRAAFRPTDVRVRGQIDELVTACIGQFDGLHAAVLLPGHIL